MMRQIMNVERDDLLMKTLGYIFKDALREEGEKWVKNSGMVRSVRPVTQSRPQGLLIWEGEVHARDLRLWLIVENKSLTSQFTWNKTATNNNKTVCWCLKERYVTHARKWKRLRISKVGKQS